MDELRRFAQTFAGPAVVHTVPIGLSHTGAYMVHYRLAQRRSETHFSEVLRHGFAPVNRVTLRMSHLREVNRARSVVCDNPIGTDRTSVKAGQRAE